MCSTNHLKYDINKSERKIYDTLPVSNILNSSSAISTDFDNNDLTDETLDNNINGDDININYTSENDLLKEHLLSNMHCL